MKKSPKTKSKIEAKSRAKTKIKPRVKTKFELPNDLGNNSDGNTKIKIIKIILGIIATGGIVAVAVVAPNALKAVDLFYDRKKEKYNVYKKRFYIKKTIEKMENSGLIEFYGEKKSRVRLTEKGRKELLRYQLREKTIKKPKKWDKKWRVVIFDIKENARSLRTGLRTELANLGFIQLQKSVWVYPYECAKIISMIKTYFDIEENVLFMTVEQIENDFWLREKFEMV